MSNVDIQRLRIRCPFAEINVGRGKDTDGDEHYGEIGQGENISGMRIISIGCKKKQGLNDECIYSPLHNTGECPENVVLT